MKHEQLKQLQVHAVELSLGLESKLSIGVVADIDRRRLLAAIKVIAERHPLLDIEVLTAPQDDVLAMLHSGRVSLCLAFAGLSMNVLERFQFVGSERMIATLAADSPLLQGQDLFLEDLVHVRQIVVASRDLPISETRPLVAESCWRTDNLETALEMVEAGLGWGNFPLSVVQSRLDSGRLKRLNFRNIENGLVLPVHAVRTRTRPGPRGARAVSPPRRCWPPAAAWAGPHANRWACRSYWQTAAPPRANAGNCTAAMAAASSSTPTAPSTCATAPSNVSLSCYGAR